MNNVFSAKRFGKYFSYDLKHCMDTFGLSLLILGLMPMITFLFASIISFIVSGDWVPDNTVNRIVAAVIAVFIATIMFPIKAYGEITDKKAGSNFLMVPASTFEKWLSGSLMTLVIVPVALVLLLLGVDLLLGVLLPSHYGEALLLQEWFRPIICIPGDYLEMPIDIRINVLLILWVSWATSVLCFLLGAVYFKKSKIAKTILAIMIISMLLSMLSAPFAKLMPGLIESIQLGDAERVLRGFWTAVWVIDGVEIVAFLAIYYFRLRTIKH
ncbi:MAG: hypothetical protein ACI3Y4_07765 [Candidatus Cryptobacteroides sp.]